jgi:hypothetical protein
MASLSRAFSFLIAAQIQAMAILGAAWWIGSYLNENHPISFNWYAITFPVGVIAVAQMFYVVVRAALMQEKTSEKSVKKTSEQK